MHDKCLLVFFGKKYFFDCNPVQPCLHYGVLSDATTIYWCYCFWSRAAIGQSVTTTAITLSVVSSIPKLGHSFLTMIVKLHCDQRNSSATIRLNVICGGMVPSYMARMLCGVLICDIHENHISWTGLRDLIEIRLNSMFNSNQLFYLFGWLNVIPCYNVACCT